MEHETKFEITTTPEFDFENQTLTMETVISDCVSTYIKHHIDFKEECTIKALVSLGWTPPPEQEDVGFIIGHFYKVSKSGMVVLCQRSDMNSFGGIVIDVGNDLVYNKGDYGLFNGSLQRDFIKVQLRSDGWEII